MTSYVTQFHNVYHFDASTSIPEQTDKIILVTGGNAGVGLESVRQLARHRPAKIYLAARTGAKFDLAIQSILKDVPEAKSVVEFLELDLASFASVKAAAEKVLSENDRLDVLLNNAGVMALPPGTTQEGYEIQFGTNHMGHALLTRRLMPLLLTTAEAGREVRVVNLSSAAEQIGALRGQISFDQLKTDMRNVHTYMRYGQSKLANVLFTRELAKRYPSVTSVAVHPGRVRTQLLDTFFQKRTLAGWLQGFMDAIVMMPVEKGALSQLWAASDNNKDKNGQPRVHSGSYYWPVGWKQAGSKLSRDAQLAGKLWEWQEKEFTDHGL